MRPNRIDFTVVGHKTGQEGELEGEATADEEARRQQRRCCDAPHTLRSCDVGFESVVEFALAR